MASDTFERALTSADVIGVEEEGVSLVLQIISLNDMVETRIPFTVDLLSGLIPHCARCNMAGQIQLLNELRKRTDEENIQLLLEKILSFQPPETHILYLTPLLLLFADNGKEVTKSISRLGEFVLETVRALFKRSETSIPTMSWALRAIIAHCTAAEANPSGSMNRFFFLLFASVLEGVSFNIHTLEYVLDNKEEQQTLSRLIKEANMQYSQFFTEKIAAVMSMGLIMADEAFYRFEYCFLRSFQGLICGTSTPAGPYISHIYTRLSNVVDNLRAWNRRFKRTQDRIPSASQHAFTQTIAEAYRMLGTESTLQLFVEYKQLRYCYWILFSLNLIYVLAESSAQNDESIKDIGVDTLLTCYNETLMELQKLYAQGEIPILLSSNDKTDIRTFLQTCIHVADRLGIVPKAHEYSVLAAGLTVLLNLQIQFEGDTKEIATLLSDVFQQECGDVTSLCIAGLLVCFTKKGSVSYKLLQEVYNIGCDGLLPFLFKLSPSLCITSQHFELAQAVLQTAPESGVSFIEALYTPPLCWRWYLREYVASDTGKEDFSFTLKDFSLWVSHASTSYLSLHREMPRITPLFISSLCQYLYKTTSPIIDQLVTLKDLIIKLISLGPLMSLVYAICSISKLVLNGADVPQEDEFYDYCKDSVVSLGLCIGWTLLTAGHLDDPIAVEQSLSEEVRGLVKDMTKASNTCALIYHWSSILAKESVEMQPTDVESLVAICMGVKTTLETERPLSLCPILAYMVSYWLSPTASTYTKMLSLWTASFYSCDFQFDISSSIFIVHKELNSLLEVDGLGYPETRCMANIFLLAVMCNATHGDSVIDLANTMATTPSTKKETFSTPKKQQTQARHPSSLVTEGLQLLINLSLELVTHPSTTWSTQLNTFLSDAITEDYIEHLHELLPKSFKTCSVSDAISLLFNLLFIRWTTQMPAVDLIDSQLNDSPDTLLLLIRYVLQNSAQQGLLVTIMYVNCLLGVLWQRYSVKYLLSKLTQPLVNSFLGFWTLVTQLYHLLTEYIHMPYVHLIQFAEVCFDSLGTTMNTQKRLSQLQTVWVTDNADELLSPFDFFSAFLAFREGQETVYSKSYGSSLPSSPIRGSVRPTAKTPVTLQTIYHDLMKLTPQNTLVGLLQKYTLPTHPETIEVCFEALFEFSRQHFLPYLFQTVGATEPVRYSSVSHLLSSPSTARTITNELAKITTQIMANRSELPNALPKSILAQISAFEQCTAFLCGHMSSLTRTVANTMEIPETWSRLEPQNGPDNFLDALVTHQEQEYYKTMLLRLRDRFDTLPLSSLATSSIHEEDTKGSKQHTSLLSAIHVLMPQLDAFQEEIETLVVYTFLGDQTICNRTEVQSLLSQKSNEYEEGQSEILSEPPPVMVAKEILKQPVSMDSLLIPNSLDQLTSIHTQLCNALRHAMPLELLNIVVPSTGQTGTQLCNVLEQFLQIHYNLISLMILHSNQHGTGLRGYLEERIKLFTQAITNYCLGAYRRVHPCLYDTRSRGNGYQVDFYVFNSNYLLTMFRCIRFHHQQLVCLLLAEKVFFSEALNAYCVTVELSQQALMPLLGYWLALAHNLMGNRMAVRTLRYIQDYRSLVTMEGRFAKDLVLRVSETPTMVQETHMVRFMTSLGYSYRTIRMLLRVLKDIGFNKQASEAFFKNELKLLGEARATVVDNTHLSLVVLLCYENECLPLDLQNSLVDYDGLDNMMTRRGTSTTIPGLNHFSLQQLETVSLYSCQGCTLGPTTRMSLTQLLGRMTALRNHNYMYEAIKTVQCTGCKMDSVPHALIQYRSMRLLPPNKSLHGLLISNYSNLRGSAECINFAFCTRALQLHLQGITTRLSRTYHVAKPTIFLPTHSFILSRGAILSCVDTFTFRKDKYVYKEQIPPGDIDLNNEYTLNSLAFWIVLLRLFLSRFENTIQLSRVTEDLSQDLSTRSFSPLNLYTTSQRMVSAAQTATARDAIIFTQKMSQLADDMCSTKQEGVEAGSIQETSSRSDSFLPYGTQTSPFFLWVQSVEHEGAYVLVCKRFATVCALLFATKETVFRAIAHHDLPAYILPDDSYQRNSKLLLTIERCNAVLSAELPELKAAIIRLYVEQRFSYWTDADTAIIDQVLAALKLGSITL
ncbi:hypothetical protein GMRT_15166 [Giardia muris]|uniref:Uncharacterized protein n=1 Tax=Giardia muris TaxID=5742 RepID=A0A4Z1SQH1_GIAMU|nr:hypothetical protein GMRT_15166 [Giardia muris]|eukprot:TNJ28102.1 hypothetical protein GMRT_15166 [Giardia muris]